METLFCEGNPSVTGEYRPMFSLSWAWPWAWWRHQMETFSALLALWEGNPLGWISAGWFPLTKDQWRGALRFSLICVWTNGWANNRDADDLKRHWADYDITLMTSCWQQSITRVSSSLVSSQLCSAVLDKSTLVQVMAWCRQATSHYLSQCWHSSELNRSCASL